MKLSIIVCTYNRCQFIEKLLNKFEGCYQENDLDWELLIIDNNSIDETKETVEKFKMRNKHIRYSIERKQGLSNARNHGIDMSYGKYLFFMDDDALPDPCFLTDAFKVINDLPHAQVIGTKVISYFPDKPKWFATEGTYALRGILGIYDLGTNYKKISQKDPLPIGSGMLVKKSWIQTIGGFDCHIGVKGDTTITGRGEDTDLMMNAMISGAIMYYSPIPKVHHYPDLNRYNIGRLREMFFGTGYFSKLTNEENMIKILGIDRYLFKSVFVYYFKSIVSFFCANLKASVYYKTRFWLDLGRLAGQVFEKNEKGILFIKKIFQKFGPWVL